MLRRFLLFLSLVSATALVGCSNGGGATQADIDSAVVAAESRVQAKVDQQITELESRIEALTQQLADAQALVRSEPAGITSEAVRKLELALCEADYWTVAAWTAVTELPAYLQNPTAGIDPAIWWRTGIRIDDNYSQWSRVCFVDENGRWQIRFQPDVVPASRLTR